MKVWDGATGELLCADARQQQSQSAAKGVGRKGELFSMCLGARGRTVVVGDGDGRIKVRKERARLRTPGPSSRQGIAAR